MPRKKNMQGAKDRRAANESEWQRLVQGEEFHSVLVAMRVHLGGLPVDTQVEMHKWIEAYPDKTSLMFKELRAIADRHEIPFEKWGNSLMYLLMLDSWEMWTFALDIDIDNKGRVVMGPSVDMNDPDTWLVAQHLIGQDRPPQPQPKKGNPRGEKDWRLVEEWHLRNPRIGTTRVTKKWIAEVLGRNASNVRKKLSRLRLRR